MKELLKVLTMIMTTRMPGLALHSSRKWLADARSFSLTSWISSCRLIQKQVSGVICKREHRHGIFCKKKLFNSHCFNIIWFNITERVELLKVTFAPLEQLPCKQHAWRHASTDPMLATSGRFWHVFSYRMFTREPPSRLWPSSGKIWHFYHDGLKT